MVHLKIRTEYSFGQTYAPIPRIVARLKEMGVRAAGIVDLNSTWGHIHWYDECKKAGIKPLLGIEVMVDGSLMWFLAKNKEGLAELYKAVSDSYGIKNTPNLSKTSVLNMSENIIKFAGHCLDEVFLRQCGAIVDLSPASRILNVKKKNLNLPTVEVCDNYYAYEEDKLIFSMMPKGGIKPTPQHIIPVDCDEDFDIDIELPSAPMLHFEGDLEKMCREGIEFRKLAWNEEYEQRLQYELSLIKMKNFESYFLIVADMVQFAKQHMLVGPSRGSAAGSLVCYLTRITEVDPIPHNLFFERFIDVSRTDLPDIDLDFPDSKRYMVFNYMADKYGTGNVSHIGTISRYKPRSALIQTCKAMNIPPQATGAVKVAMIERSSADSRANNCLEDTFNTTEPGRKFIEMYPEAIIAAKLEGHASHHGVHAAGLLVCNEPITNYAVVDSNGIAHIEKGPAERLGLLKIDVLGLRTLTILEDAGTNIDWYNLSYDDEKTYGIFNSGKLCGIFQFEGNALRAISSEITFKSLTEVDAVTALARPGPFGGGVTEKYVRRMKGESYTGIHPLVDEHMKETFGLPVYQEQTLAIVREIGKFDWKETSTIRKAMSKRMGKEFFDSYWNKFEAGAASQGISTKDARKTWEMINSMGAWQMNKSHTRSYAIISYWTAYLKAHHPLEFAAANLRNTRDEDKAILLLREMVREGIEYVPFDIQLSEENWCVKDGKLIGGFLCLKGIGERKAKELVIARNACALTEKQLNFIESCENPFAELFPIGKKYGRYYEDHKGCNVLSPVVKICELENIPHKQQRVFIGELIYKNARNANEEVNVKKRGGKLETGPLEFVDVRLRDDTGQIGGRIGRYDYQRIGKELLENIPIGTVLLVRAIFYNNIRYAFIKKWKVLND